jgi:hypothetical protein
MMVSAAGSADRSRASLRLAPGGSALRFSDRNGFAAADPPRQLTFLVQAQYLNQRRQAQWVLGN